MSPSVYADCVNGNYSRNLTVKVWANLDNPIKSYDFSKLWLMSCMPQWHKSEADHGGDSDTFFFRTLHFPSSFFLGMLGLRWLCMHLWLNLINWSIDVQDKLKIVKIYVQSHWRVILLWYHRFWQSDRLDGSTLFFSELYIFPLLSS